MDHANKAVGGATIAIMIMACLATGAVRGEAVSREDLLRLLRASREKLSDVEFVYEGSLKQLRNPDFEKVPKRFRNPHPLGPDDAMRFQGRFAYRRDGRAHLDLYTWQAPGEHPVTRNVACLIGDGKVHLQTFHPGGGPLGPALSEPGGISYFLGGYRPWHFDVFPWLVSLLSDSGHYEYEFVGWEDLGGRRCLAVRLQDLAKVYINEFWIDLERHGNVLRFDEVVRGKRISQAIDVDLVQVSDARGEIFWLPTRGRYVCFQDLWTLLDEPVTEETFGIIQGTLLINRGLRNDRFMLAYRPGATAAVAVQRAGTAAVAVQRKDSTIRTVDGSKSLDDRLDSMLAEADRQSSELEASSPDRSGTPRNFWSWALAGAGIVSILSAAVLRRRFS